MQVPEQDDFRPVVLVQTINLTLGGNAMNTVISNSPVLSAILLAFVLAGTALAVERPGRYGPAATSVAADAPWRTCGPRACFPATRLPRPRTSSAP